VATFRRLDDERSRIMVRMQRELEGMLEELVATLGYDEMIERRGSGGGMARSRGRVLG